MNYLSKKKPLMLLLIVACFFAINLGAQSSQKWIFASAFGKSGINKAEIIATDAIGNTFIAGTFEGTAVPFGNFTLNSRGAADVFIAKLNNAGDLLWARSLGAGGADGVSDIITDASGNCYVSGYFFGQI